MIVRRHHKVVHSLHNATITPTYRNPDNKVFTGGVYDQNKKLFKPAERSHVMSKLMFMNPSQITPQSGEVTINSRSVYLGHYTHHYGHFLLETMSRMWAIEEGNKYSHYIFHSFFDNQLYNDRFSPAKVCFECFGISPKSITIITKPTEVSELDVPERLISVNDCVDLRQANVYQSVLNYCQSLIKPENNTSNRIYLSRKNLHSSGSADRIITNEEEIENLFKLNGFSIIAAEELSFPDQVSQVNNAEMIAGFGGSAMHNVLFANKQCRVIILGSLREPNEPNINQLICNRLSQVSVSYIPLKINAVSNHNGAIEVDSKFIRSQLLDIIRSHPKKEKNLIFNRSRPAQTTDKRILSRQNTRPGSGVCVLGMHRSGTSSLATFIERLGFFAGDIVRNSYFQYQGNRENEKIIYLNDLLLSHNNATWYSPPGTLTWNSEHVYARDKIIWDMERQSKLWMFKDPRTLLTLPFWEDKILPTYKVGIFRHPMSVALSLFNRDNIPLREGVKLWIEYNLHLLKAHCVTEFPLLCFDSDKRNFNSQLQFICKTLQKDFSLSQQEETSLNIYRDDSVHFNRFEFFPPDPENPYENMDADLDIINEAGRIYSALIERACSTGKKKNDQGESVLIPINQSIGSLKDAIDCQGENDVLFNLLARAYGNESDRNNEEIFLRKSLDINQSQSRTRRELISILVEQNRSDEAMSLLPKLVEEGTNSSGAVLISLCELLLKQHKFEAVLELESVVSQKVNEHHYLYALFGKAYRMLKMYEEAIQLYKRCLETGIEKKYIYIPLIELYIMLNDFDKAKLICLKGLEHEYLDADLTFLLGDIEAALGEKDLAINNYILANEAGLKHVYGYIKLCRYQIEVEAYSEARILISKAVDMEPNHIDVIRCLGDIAMHENKDSEAINWYQKALAIEPEKTGVLISLGSALKRLGRIPDARDVFERALKVDPANQYAKEQLNNFGSKHFD